MIANDSSCCRRHSFHIFIEFLYHAVNFIFVITSHFFYIFPKSPDFISMLFIIKILAILFHISLPILSRFTRYSLTIKYCNEYFPFIHLILLHSLSSGLYSVPIVPPNQ